MRHLVLAPLLLLAAAFPATAMASGWSDPAAVGGPTSTAVSVGVGDDGSAVALWQNKSDLFAALRDAGAPFAAPVKLASEAGSPSLAVGDGGDAVAVWRDKPTNSLLAATKAHGAPSFGEPAAFSGTGARSPDVAVDKFGSAIV